jgi:hypothetical protein
MLLLFSSSFYYALLACISFCNAIDNSLLVRLTVLRIGFATRRGERRAWRGGRMREKSAPTASRQIAAALAE